MSAVSDRSIVPFTQLEQLREARAIIRREGDALQELSNQLDTRFCTALQTLVNCRGCVIVAGLEMNVHIGYWSSWCARIQVGP